MNIDESTAAWIETVVLGLVAAFLFQSGLLLLVFLVPLQFLWVKRGPNSYFVASIVAVAGVLAAKIVQAAGVESAGYGLLFADMLLPAAFVVGLYVMNRRWTIAGTEISRGVYRLLMAVAVAFVVTLPLVIYLASQDVLRAAVGQQLVILESVLGGESNIASGQAREALAQLAVDVFYGTYVSGLSMVLALGWYVGHRIARRYKSSVPDVRRFAAPETLVWPFVGALGLTALTVAIDLGFLRYAIWNATLVLGFLYALQGYAIARHLLDRFGAPRGLQFALVVVLVMMLFIPGVNLIVVVGLPGLGLSETWVRYNRGIER